MGLLQNLIKGMGEDKKVLKSKMKEAEQDMRVQKAIEERQKSSNRRELEKFMKEKDEEKVNIALAKLRKERGAEIWKSKHSVLDTEKSILTNDRPILKEKNIFKNNKHIFAGHKGVFMK